MPVSSKIARQMEESSWIRKMFEEGLRLKKKFGADKVYDFTLGNPDLDPPEAFQRRLRHLVEHPAPHLHGYMPNAGFPEAREAVARWVSEESGIEVPADHVILCVGAGGGLNVVLKTILDAGDEVVVFSPYFVEYLFYIDNHGGVPVIAETGETFDFDLARLDAKIGPRTRAVIVNSPNNPTGVVYEEASLRRLADLLREKSARFGQAIYLISDDPYKKILFDGATYPHVFPIYEHSIVVYSHSKDLGLAGERIGHVAVHPGADAAAKLVAGMIFAIRVLGFVNAPALMQLAVMGCLRDGIDPRVYERRRDVLYGALTGMGFEIVKPRGAFYMFPKSPIPDDREFVEKCVERNVLVVPGIGFGRAGYFRISLTVPDRTIESSLAAWGEVSRAFGGVRA
jgi:aspartate aminotransferase